MGGLGLNFNDGPRWARILRNTFVAFAIVNFIALGIVSLCLGGDAWRGKVEDGQHYVGSRGNYTAVSPAVWTFSYFHVWSMIVTHALGAVAALTWIVATESTRGTPIPRQ